MSAPTADPPPPGTHAPAFIYQRLIWWLLLGFATFYMVWLIDYGFAVGDEGVALVDAWRILRGEVPHRDFFEIIPPASFLPTALAFKLLGLGLRSSRILTLLYGLLLIISSDLVLRRLVSDHRVRLLLCALLIPFGVFYWPMPSHHWFTDICQMFAAAALLRGLAGNRPSLSGGVAGILTGLAGFSLQDQGAYFALLLVAAFFPLVPERTIRRRMFMGWCAGLFIVTLAFALYLLPHVSLGEFIEQTISFPLHHYRGQQNQGGLFHGWSWRPNPNFWQSPMFYGGEFLVLSLLAILPLLALVLVAAATAFRWQGRAAVALVAALTLSHLGSCAHRWSQTNVVFAAPPMFVLLCWALARASSHRAAPVRIGAIALGSVLFVAVLAVALGDLDKRAPDRTYPLVTPAGIPRLMNQRKTAEAQRIVDAIEKYVAPDAPLFCNFYFPLYNFLTLRPNPTRYTIFIHPEYNTLEQVTELTASLDAHPDAHLLMEVPLKSAELSAYVTRNYRVQWTGSGTMLLVRKSE